MRAKTPSSALRTFTESQGPRSSALFADSGSTGIDSQLIRALKELSRCRGDQNIRLCLHSSPQANFHNMIILERQRGRYYRPHKHSDKDETCHLIEGEIALFLFDQEGRVTKTVEISSEATMVFRVEASRWHTLIPVTDTVVYHESKLGPFLGDNDSIYPSWAPDGCDQEAARLYIANLMKVFH